MGTVTIGLRFLGYVLLLSSLVACAHVSKTAPILLSQLDGQWLYVTGEHEPDRIPNYAKRIRIPSNWWVEGVHKHGVIWFYRYVTLPVKAKQFKVHFDGVDYQADVFWDGQHVGQHQGYFSPFEVMLPKHTSMNQQHLLAVRVDSPKEDSVHWHQNKRLIKGVLSHHDTRPGGAWSLSGQDGNTGGVWGSVWLKPVLGAELDHVRVTTLHLENQKAQLELHLTFGQLNQPMNVGVEIHAPDGSIVYRKRWLNQTETEIQESFVLEDPMLWSSWDYGDAHLYRVHIRVEQEKYQQTYEQHFGVRTIERDTKGRWLLNGTPVFLRGTNHIPSLYLSKLTKSSLRHDFILMKEANINAVRVHAHITSPLFYDLADEMGIMVWQDFPLQWGYQDQLAVHASIMFQLEEMVNLLQHHPSIIFWNGHNEAPWSALWMKDKYPHYYPDQNKQLDQQIALKLQMLDPTRPSQGNSPSSEHLWFGWYSDHYQKFSQPQSISTVSELGAQAVPNIETLKTFFKPEQLWPIQGDNADVWKYHNFQKRELTQNALVSMGKSLEELVKNSQVYQAHLIQYAVENLRLQMWQPIAGIFQFMFAEHWPSIGWGVLDYQRQQKKGYQVLKQAYQPILPVAQCVPQQETWQCSLSVVNDSMRYYSNVTLEVRDGSQFFSTVVEINRQTVTSFSISYPVSGKQLHLLLRDHAGHVLAENIYTKAYFKALVK